MFTEAGLPDAIISGSNDLDEYLIQSLKHQGATITSWGCRNRNALLQMVLQLWVESSR